MGKINIYNDPEWVGKTYEKLTVLEPVRITQSSGFGAWYWKCRCECGNETTVRPRDLIVGKVKSCGCLKAKVTGDRRRVHGENKTRLHRIWVAMRKRCGNPNDSSYPRYGGRGITVCGDWQEYKQFRTWAMENGYQDGLTIDRIDVNGNYEPGNCRWADLKTQARNKRGNYLVEINGETKPLAEWCEIYHANYDLTHNRIHDAGWEPLKALTTTSNHKGQTKKLT